MLNRRLKLQASFLALSLSFSALATSAFAGPQARLATYETAAGQTTFALSLTPGIEGDSAKPCDVVVLFDTSASQIGAYRDDGLSALSTFLGSLPADDRVKLVAVDLEAIELTQGFVAPQSKEIEAAIAALEQRAPLGATDMARVLQNAVDSFEGAATSPRCAVYIGDGMSKANYVDQNEFADLMKEMVDRQISFSSYIIGPQRDIQFVAAIANNTGGMMYVDTKETNGPQAGDALSQIVRGTVVWPKSVTLPKSVDEVFPRQVPPLRSDRDTILIGTLNRTGALEIAMTADVQGEPQDFTWQVTAERPNGDDFAFLPQLIESARIDDGLTLPTVGTVGLLEARRVLLASARDLSKLSRQALVSGNEDGARKLAEAALQSDPENLEAQRIQDALENEEILQKQDATGAPDDLTLINDAPGGPGGGSLLEEYEAEEGRFLELVEQEQAIYEEKIVAEVEEGLKAARDMMGVDPDGAVANLKLLLERVDQAIDLNVEVRSQLRNQIESAVREASRRAVEEGERRTLAEQNRAAAIERQRLVEATGRQQIKIEQLMELFNSLMDEGRYNAAEDDVAVEIRKLAPNNPVSESILHNVRFVSNIEMMKYHREMRHKKFVDTLHQVELSHIPFPDEPPIVYPPAEVWHELTMKRLKYRAVDLAQRGSNEEKIFAALDETTKIDFIEVPLQDVVDYLADLHKIPVVIDSRALDTVGLGSDTPITRRLEGISLKSALKLLLKELELTYVISDEVLQITTHEEANANLTTKVYPVGDLVVPIQAGQVNPFQTGGGLTGQGGQGGGGNQGGGGFGGGFGGGLGGGGGGLGGGVFAVEDDLNLDGKKSEQPDKSAAKPDAGAQRIVIDGKAGETPAQAWDRYFSENDPALAAVRETVRGLTGEAERAFARGDRKVADAKFGEVIDLIHAALRHGHPQPWMYEAMAIAMQASGRPQAEIERTLMSAVDFSDNLDDMMWAAAYMARLEFDKRALQLFRDVAAANPSRPEPYIQGLASAKRLDDIDGIRWACVGILQRAWQTEHSKIEEEAFRTAQATLLRLRHEKRFEEAKQFDAELSQALVRDLIVRVSWTGDADIDVVVEEPSGSVCSLRNARTTSGGVLQGDAWAVEGKQSLDGYSETYTCPQAFAGKYRIYLRRIWGRPTADKVKVEIATRLRTDEQKIRTEYIDFGNQGAVVLYDLHHGRRQESLPEEEVANVAKAQIAFNRAVLSQQLSMLENSAATRSYAVDQVVAARDGRLNRGGVGFRPVITNLPQGTNQTMSGIISADRRYVRINSTPLFSSVGDVATFTFAQ